MDSKINTAPVGSKYLSIIILTKWCILVPHVCMCPVILEVVRQIVKSIKKILLRTSLSSAAPGWCWPAALRHHGTSWSWSPALPPHAFSPWPVFQISFPPSEVCPPVLVAKKMLSNMTADYFIRFCQQHILIMRWVVSLQMEGFYYVILYKLCEHVHTTQYYSPHVIATVQHAVLWKSSEEV